ncbi:uncharacterized protein LOC117272740 [Epinephelus lanceolatus]
MVVINACTAGRTSRWMILFIQHLQQDGGDQSLHSWVPGWLCLHLLCPVTSDDGYCLVEHKPGAGLHWFLFAGDFSSFLVFVVVYKEIKIQLLQLLLNCFFN